MKNSRRILIIVALVVSLVRIDAQLLLTEHCAYKIEGDKILLRWEPKSVEDWMNSKKEGYTVEMYRISPSGVEESLGMEVIKPTSKSDWMKYEDSVSDFMSGFVEGARSFVYPDKEGGTNPLEQIFETKGDQAKSSKISLGFLMYTSSYNFEIAKLAGLGFEMKFEKEFTYRYSIKTGNTDAINILVDPNTYQESNMPKVFPEWSNREVVLKWDGSRHQGDFLGYMLSKSEDGVNYVKLNETPRISNLGLLPDSSALLQMTYTDTLEENNKTYWYKVEGFDYFGSISDKKQIVSGQGYMPIAISPIIEFADQTEDNHAHLKWFLPEEMEKLVDRYRITRSDNDKGPYEIVIDSLDNTINEVKFPMERTENHFRVEAVPHRGKSVGSISVFIMGQDTVPPEVPEIIGAFIDSVGNIEVKWKANTEQDLWGYRIFKSNFDKQEYGLVNSVITKDTVFRDTIDIKFKTKHVFYKIYATDTRDNKSAFTIPIKIEKPDLFPPGMASLGKIEQRNDSILIHWKPSASDDVVNHHVFRRAINADYAWTLAGILDSTMVDEPFVDKGLEFGASYAYTIIAYDKVGLKSKAAHPKKITLKRTKEKFIPKISLTHDFNEANKEITLSWKFDEASRIKHILVYRGTKKKKLGKYKLLEGGTQNMVDIATNEESLFYKVKPIYKGQTEDYYSETVEVRISKSE